MVSTYSPNLGIELPARGDDVGTWDVPLNNDLGTLIESAICRGTTVNYNTDADQTVVISNGSDSAGRYFELNLSGSATLSTTRNLIVPTVYKNYMITNNTVGGQSVVVKTAAGTGVTVPNGASQLVFANNVNVVDQVSNVSALTVAGVGVVTASSVTNFSNKTIDTANSNVLKINGNTLAASAAGGATITLPASTDQLVGRNTTDILTNKTLTNPVENNPTVNTPTISGGTATSLTLTNPSGVVTQQAFAAGANITLTGTTNNTSTGTLTIAAGSSGGTVTSATFKAGPNITLTGTTAITTSGTLTIAGNAGTVTGVTLAAGTGITITGTNPITGTGTATIATTGGAVPGTLTAGTTNTMNPYASSTSSTQAHSLGAAPTLVDAYLQCLTAEHNYNVGDRVRLTSAQNGNASVAVSADATSTFIVVSGNNPPTLVDRNTNSAFTLTQANWEIVVIPYKLN